MTLTPEAAQAISAQTLASMPTTLTQFACPICGKTCVNYEDLKFHYAAEHPDAVVPITVKLTVNEKECEVLIEPHWTLHRTLQFKLGLTGAKQMCDRGVCGSCTVIMDGDAVTSCMLLTVDCDGRHITTIEGLQDPKTGELDPLQQAFIDEYAFQCGYCTPGMVLAGEALLRKNPNPAEADIRKALSGNLCRCTGYNLIVEAINQAAQRNQQRGQSLWSSK